MKRTATQFPQTRFSLLVRIRSEDDEAAWREFVAIYQPVIYRMARRRGLQDADAQDLTQKVLMSVAGSIESYEQREETPFRHWLRKVTSNAILKVLTRQPKDQAQGGSTIMQMLGDLPPGDDPFEREIELERQREIFLRAAAIVRTEVEPESWQVFELSVVDGLPIEEAASRTGKSVGAAYAARGRVMKRLKSAVSDMQEGFRSI